MGGLIYVADPKARRIVVLRPEDGTVRAILFGVELREPVDVAIGLDGCAYVVDREAAQVFRFSSSFRLLANFPAQNAAGLPESPKPVAVTGAPDGSILVIDANHPRVLRFAPQGEPLADMEFSAAAEFEAARTSPAADPCPQAAKTPSTVTAEQRLAAEHRRTRLLAFGASGRYEASGVLLSAILDSRLPGTQWHRIEIGADIPDGTRITVETATANDATDFNDSVEWQAPSRIGSPIPITAAVPEQLIQSRPGRYLRLRVTLSSDGVATPSLRWIRILYPRETYLDYLPVAYRRDEKAAWFLERFLALFERVFTGVEDRFERFSRQLNPQAAPREIIDWLACLLDLAFDPSWPLERRRNLVARAMDLYKRRGTPRGACATEAATGVTCEFQDNSLRTGSAAYVVSRGHADRLSDNLSEDRYRTEGRQRQREQNAFSMNSPRPPSCTKFPFSNGIAGFLPSLGAVNPRASLACGRRTTEFGPDALRRAGCTGDFVLRVAYLPRFLSEPHPMIGTCEFCFNPDNCQPRRRSGGS
ncbi:MAG: hypothetical protein IH987_11055 [Planctomycetes bacterium]|nr:hypothetical protein [Planctomycetota bacterium]